MNNNNDLISRADAMSTIIKWASGEGGDIVELIESLPSAEAVEVIHDTEWVALRRDEYEDFLASADAEWIPCSERLPDANECPMDCMVTRRSKFVGNYVDMAVAEKNGTWTHEDWKAITIEGNATCISTRDADIIAWMPLPKPYEGDDDE